MRAEQATACVLLRAGVDGDRGLRWRYHAPVGADLPSATIPDDGGEARDAQNTICLWFDKDALDAARFYAATFPDSEVIAVHEAPGDFPGGKKGDVLTVEFTVVGIPCLGLNGGPAFKHSEAFSFQIATDDQEETDRYWNAIVNNGGEESECGWCKDRWGLLADHAARADRCACSWWRRGQACLRSDADDEKTRRRCHRGGTAGLTAGRRQHDEAM